MSCINGNAQAPLTAHYLGAIHLLKSKKQNGNKFTTLHNGGAQKNGRDIVQTKTTGNQVTGDRQHHSNSGLKYWRYFVVRLSPFLFVCLQDFILCEIWRDEFHFLLIQWLSYCISSCSADHHNEVLGFKWTVLQYISYYNSVLNPVWPAQVTRLGPSALNLQTAVGWPEFNCKQPIIVNGVLELHAREHWFNMLPRHKKLGYLFLIR